MAATPLHIRKLALFGSVLREDFSAVSDIACPAWRFSAWRRNSRSFSGAKSISTLPPGSAR